ncbi:MAG: tetratricopeptide repeat protein [Candidatus Eisenbacteria bacterium]|nr:tetratricopeptide repeat protein [Candidatus Eisenbacteria bacterium]
MLRSFMRKRIRGGLVLLLVAASLPVVAEAAKKSYRYEDDPIRLGNNALEQGDIDQARKYFEEAIANEHQVYNAHQGQAEILALQGSYAEAEPLYRQAIIEKNKETGKEDFPEAHAGLGLTLLKLQRYEEAKQEFDTALRQKGSLWDAQYGLARILIRDGKLDEAKKLLAKGERKKGRKERADYYHYGMALVQQAEGDIQAAEKNALSAFVIYPNDPDYGTLVAQIYTARGARSLAIPVYEQALATPGLTATAPVRHSLGVLYQEEQRYNEALEQYKQAVIIDSTYALAWKDMAQLYSLAKRNEEAASAYLRYTSLRRDDPQGYRGLADVSIKARMYRPALDAAQQAYVLDSTNVETRLLRARALYFNRDRDQAKKAYASLPDTTKFEATDYVAMGQMKLEDKEFDPAQADLLRAVELDSTQADAWFSLGLLDLYQQKPDSAVLHFDRTIELAPSNSGAWMNRGLAKAQLKQTSSAVADLRKATSLAPDFAPAWSYLGNLLQMADSTGAAIQAFKTATEKDPKNAMALRGLGLSYFKRKDYANAANVLKQATTIDPGNADSWVLYGQALAVQGQTAAGLAAIKKALEINPEHENAKKLVQILEKGQQ